MIDSRGSPRPRGISVHPLGATVTRLTPPNSTHNIVLSFPEPSIYSTTGNPAFFGETIGRVANRISGGSIKSLNGQKYELAQNGDGGRNCLHGGWDGWGKRMWDGPRIEMRIDTEGKPNEAECWRLKSMHGDEGFPGTVEGRVWYSTRLMEDGGVQKLVVDVEYEVELLDEDVQETVCALTNHSYFNLSCNPTVEGTQMKIGTSLYLPLDDTSIPLGSVESLPCIKPDETITLGEHRPRFDHCLIMNPNASSVPLDTRSLAMKRLVTMYHPDTKINLVIESTEPAFQLYTGEGVDIGGYGPRAGVAVEPSRYVNAVNNPSWRHMVVMSKNTGELWGSRIRYTTWEG